MLLTQSLPAHPALDQLKPGSSHTISMQAKFFFIRCCRTYSLL